MLNSEKLEKLEKQFKDYLAKRKYYFYKAQSSNREFIVFIEKNEIKSQEEAIKLKSSVLHKIESYFREENMELCYLDELSFSKDSIKHYNPQLRQELEYSIRFKGIKSILENCFKKNF